MLLKRSLDFIGLIVSAVVLLKIFRNCRWCATNVDREPPGTWNIGILADLVEAGVYLAGGL